MALAGGLGTGYLFGPEIASGIRQGVRPKCPLMSAGIALVKHVYFAAIQLLNEKGELQWWPLATAVITSLGFKLGANGTFVIVIGVTVGVAVPLLDYFLYKDWIARVLEVGNLKQSPNQMPSLPLPPRPKSWPQLQVSTYAHQESVLKQNTQLSLLYLYWFTSLTMLSNFRKCVMYDLDFVEFWCLLRLKSGPKAWCNVILPVLRCPVGA